MALACRGDIRGTLHPARGVDSAGRSADCGSPAIRDKHLHTENAVAASQLTKRLERFAKAYPVDLVEAAVVTEFLRQHGLSTRNRMLAEAAALDPAAVGPVCDALRDAVAVLDVDTALRVFEMAIPAQDRDINGAIYTPRHIADFICARAITRGDEVVADPSCGAGAFLLAAVRRLHALSGAPTGDIIERQVVGRDILPYSVRHARLLLAMLALSSGDDRAEMRDRLSVGDALSPGWVAGVAQAGGVDAVVGNPPYIRFQELPTEVREHLSTGRWTTTGAGNFNLYFAFFEVGLGLLGPDGVLGYITPSAHFGTRSAQGLRRLLAGGGHLAEIIDCGGIPVFEVATYTAVTFLSKRRRASFVFRRPSAQAEQFDLDSVPAAERMTADLDERRWLLGYPDEVAALRAIEGAGEPLRQVAGLGVGVATLRDSLYLLGTPPAGPDGRYLLDRGGAFAIEPGLTRPVLKVSEHKGQGSLDTAATLILFPYEERPDGVIAAVPEERMAREFPGALAYLESIRPELAQRDRGKKAYEAWYAYGRRQGLAVPGRGQLLTPIYASAPRFLVDPAPGHRFLNGYAVAPKAGSPWATPDGLRALAALLSCDAMAVYVHLTSSPLAGGFRCYAGNYIANFGVPAPSTADIAALAAGGPEAAARWYAERAGMDHESLRALAARLLARGS